MTYLKVLGWRRDGSVITLSLLEDPDKFFRVLISKGVKFSNSLRGIRRYYRLRRNGYRCRIYYKGRSLVMSGNERTMGFEKLRRARIMGSDNDIAI